MKPGLQETLRADELAAARSGGDAELVRDFEVRVAFDGTEVEYGSVACWKPQDECAQVGGDEVIGGEWLGVRRVGGRRIVVYERALAGDLQGSQALVDSYAVYPATQRTSTGIELLKSLEYPRHGYLHEVFGIRTLRQVPTRRPKHLRGVRLEQLALRGALTPEASGNEGFVVRVWSCGLHAGGD